MGDRVGSVVALSPGDAVGAGVTPPLGEVGADVPASVGVGSDGL